MMLLRHWLLRMPTTISLRKFRCWFFDSRIRSWTRGWSIRIHRLLRRSIFSNRPEQGMQNNNNNNKNNNHIQIIKLSWLGSDARASFDSKVNPIGNIEFHWSSLKIKIRINAWSLMIFWKSLSLSPSILLGCSLCSPASHMHMSDISQCSGKQTQNRQIDS